MAFKRLTEFLILTAGVYASYILYSIYQQKLFNNQYVSKDGTTTKFTYASAIAFFPALCCYLVGTLRKEMVDEGHSKLPTKEQYILGGLYFIIQMTVNSALIYISYPTQLVFSNLRLITIFLISNFCTRVISNKAKSSGYSKLLIGLFITVGIFMFNYDKFKNSSQSGDCLWGIFLLLSCLVAEGFLADSQTYVKQKYSPSSNDLFTCTNKVAFFLSFGSSIVSGELRPIMNFISTYEEFGRDLFLLCVFGTLGQLFVYELIKNFEPHIYALLTVFRKIMTVVISIVMYGHSTTQLQILGLCIVFSGLIYEIHSQFKTKKEKTN